MSSDQPQIATIAAESSPGGPVAGGSGAPDDAPAKRGRGRPKGSKNKPKDAAGNEEKPKRPRGRPPKPKPEEPVAPKRRGRPPKNKEAASAPSKPKKRKRADSDEEQDDLEESEPEVMPARKKRGKKADAGAD